MSKKISLENFDIHKKTRPLLNSPKSIEACKKQGIDPQELLFQTKEEVAIRFHSERLDDANLNLRFLRLEELRKNKMKIVVEERQKFIEQEKAGLDPFGQYSMFGSTGTGGGTSTMVEREMRNMEKMKQKQLKEIEQLVQHELMQQKIRQKNEEKIRLQLEKESGQKEKVELARKLRERAKEEEEKRKQQKLVEEQQAVKERTEKQQLKLKQREEELSRREQEKIQEKRRQDEEQAQKRQQLQNQAKQQMEEQRQRLLMQKQLVEQRDHMRKEKLQHENKMKAEQMNAKQEEHEKKIQEAKKKTEQLLEFRKNEFDEKQRQALEQKLRYEKKQQQEFEENHRKAEAKQKKVQEAVKMSVQIIEEKKNQYFRKMDENELRKQLKEKELQDELAAQKRQEEELEKKRVEAKKNNEKLLQEKTHFLINKQHEKESKMTMAMSEKEKELRMKMNLENMKKLEKLENVKRTERMKDYEKQQMMLRIAKENERIQNIKKQRDGVLSQKMEIQKQLHLNKEEMVQKFQLVKEGKIDPTTLLNDGQKNLADTKGCEKNSQMPRAQPGGKMDLESKTAKAKQAVSYMRTHKGKTIDLFEFREGEPKDKAVDRLVALQNREMLELLEREQTNENARQLELKAVLDDLEKARLIKIHQVKRAKATEAVNNLNKKHTGQLKDLDTHYSNK